MRPASDSGGNKPSDETKRIILPGKTGGANDKPKDETMIFDEKESKSYVDAAKTYVNQDTKDMLPVSGKKTRLFFKPREKKPNFVLSIILTVIKLAFVAVVIAAAVGFGSIMGIANAYLETSPELDTGKIEDQNLTSYIYDQEGNLLVTYWGQENRDWASINDIPKNLQSAVIAVEDIRFYEHNGIDFRRLAGAFAANLSSSTVEGGSTITQQLIKNKLLTNERSYKRKLQEAYLAMQLENKYSKDEILEAYLNTIPLGGKIYGVKTAAKEYFDKELSQLNLKEMVCIAAITQSSTKFNPRRATYVKPEDLPYLIDRMNIITERMLWNKMITQEEYNATYIPNDVYLSPLSTKDENGAKHLVLADGYLDRWKSEMNILEVSPANSVYKYPHFVEYVINDVQTFMMKQQGLDDTAENRLKVDREMRSNGYKIYCTIDSGIQETVQETIASWDRYPDFRNSSDNEVTSTDYAGNQITIKQPQAAAVVVENETGYLRAIVGSRETPEDMRTFNRAYEGKMQIGSSIKPIAVYGPAFDMGYSLASSVANLPVPITGWPVTDTDPGYPQTSNGDMSGPISLHNAIVKSINIAAARTLADYVGIPSSSAHLQQTGVDPSHLSETIVGLALGASPITPIEVAGAYSAIPRGGEFLQPISFTKVLDSKGNVVIDAEAEREQHQGFKKSSAWMLNLALEDAVDHGTGTNAKIEGMTTAGKTGTVVQNKGAFFAGYTPYYTSSLWVGHDEFKSFESGSGGAICAPLWKSYMSKIHEGLSDKEIFPGDPSQYGVVKGQVCKYSNMKLTSACSPSEEDWMAVTDIPTQECTMCGAGSSVTICSVSGMPVGEFCPPETHVTQYIRSFPPYSPYSVYYGTSREIVDPETGIVTYEPTGGGSQYGGAPCNYHTAEWLAAQQAAVIEVPQEEVMIPPVDDQTPVPDPEPPAPDPDVPPPEPDVPEPEPAGPEPEDVPPAEPASVKGIDSG